jgi:hypothetical protein
MKSDNRNSTFCQRKMLNEYAGAVETTYFVHDKRSFRYFSAGRCVRLPNHAYNILPGSAWGTFDQYPAQATTASEPAIDMNAQPGDDAVTVQVGFDSRSFFKFHPSSRINTESYVTVDPDILSHKFISHRGNRTHHRFLATSLYFTERKRIVPCH